MLVQNMKLPSDVLVMDLINRSNDTNFNYTDLVITEIGLTGSNTTIDGTAYKRETGATLRPILGGRLKDTVKISYHRLDASRMFNNIVVPVAVDKQLSTVDVIDDINRELGLMLTVDDIIQEPINITKLPATFTVKFKPNNAAWMGQIWATVRREPYKLEEWVINRILPIIQYPTNQSTLIQGPLYAYPHDFSRFDDTLSKYSNGSDTTLLLTALNDVIKNDTWVERPIPEEFNISGAEVIYNGPIKEPYSTRKLFKSVLVVRLSELCTNVAGYITIHYGKV